jgi:Tfp pilus assembly protein PilO
MKLSPLYQALIIGFLLFAGVVVLYYEFLLKPVNVRIGQLSDELDQKKKDLDEAKKTMAKYVEFKKRSDSVQRELEWIQNRIPKLINKSQLLESLNLVQSRSGIILTSFQMTSQVNARDTYTEIPVNLKFNTNYAGLLNFLYQTSISPLLMTVNGIVVLPFINPDPNNTQLTLTAQVVLNGVQAK